MRVIATGVLVKKGLHQEVAEALGKDSIDDKVVGRVSDILKYLKALSVADTSVHVRSKRWALSMIAKYKQDGTQELYDKVLLGRRTHV